METIKFPWVEEIPPQASHPTPPPKRVAPWKRYYYLLRPYLPYLLVLGLLIVGAAWRRHQEEALPFHGAPRGPRTLPVVISLVAIPKGHPVPVEALDVIEIRAASLSKVQTLRAFTPEQLDKLTHKIVAKKDIPSQVPIFWNDLELASPIKKSRKPTIPQILF